MNKIIFSIFIALNLFMGCTLAHNIDCDKPQKLPHKETREIDKILNERLNFTKEQKEIIRENHGKFKKEMDKVISQMQKEHDKIRDIYLSGIPAFQTNLRSTPAKARLVSLKQQAESLRAENRKNFEKILTPQQKEEFEKIKLELKKLH